MNIFLHAFLLIRENKSVARIDVLIPDLLSKNQKFSSAILTADITQKTNLFNDTYLLIKKNKHSILDF